jgi:hypothetical protein
LDSKALRANSVVLAMDESNLEESFFNKYSFSFACVPGTFPFTGISEFLLQFDDYGHRVHTEWRRPLSGVHSIMMEILAQVGDGGGCTSTPFLLYLPSRTYKVAVYAPAEWADTPPISSLPLYVLCGFEPCIGVSSVESRLSQRTRRRR